MIQPSLKCFGCTACYSICESDAIEMKMNSIGFYYPQIDNAKCTLCDKCDAVCPIGKEKAETENRFFAIKAKDNTKRMKSTSGGVFQLLAENYIEKNNGVFGAAFDEEFNVLTRKAETLDEIKSLLGTKYVQCQQRDSFSDAEKELKAGRNVLFASSPCLVDGLLNYLGKEYDNLLLVDHICYGSPSPGLWKKYVSYLEKTHGRLNSFTFRDKRKPDSAHTLSFSAGGKEYYEDLNSNRYSRLFFKNLSLRDSCFTCPYTTVSRRTDITIGDFWGIEKTHKEFDDGYGVSLAITHTDKGLKAIEAIKEHCHIIEVSKEDAMQPRLSESGKVPFLRKFFLKDIESLLQDSIDIETIFKKYSV